MLTTGLPAQQSTIAGSTFNWGQSVITNYGFLYGSGLITRWQSVYGAGQILGDATLYSNSVLSLVFSKTSAVNLRAGVATVNGNGVLMGDSINPIFASGEVLGNGVVLSAGTTRADTMLRNASGSSILGDSTNAMSPAP